MRKIGVLVVIMCLVVLSGCSSESKDGAKKEAHASFDEIIISIKEQVAEDLKADGVEEDVLVDGKLIYHVETDLTATEDSDPAVAIWIEKMGLNQEELANGRVIAAMMNVNADEIILLEAKDEKQVAALKESLEKELNGQVQTWEQYLPDQYEKVKNNIIKTNGKYLLYVTYTHPDNIEKVFDSSFK